MTKQITPAKEPAEFGWKGGDQPGKLVFSHEPATAIARAVTEALGTHLPGSVDASVRVTLLSPSATITGRYLVAAKSASWFAKVSARTCGSPTMEQAVTQFLEGRGVHVAALLVAEAPLLWEGRSYRMDVQRFIDGRHFDGSVEDLQQLALSLRACHTALRDFPQAALIRSNAAARYAQLLETRRVILEAVSTRDFTIFAEHASWAAAHWTWFERMGAFFNPIFDQAADAQCLHGEIHPANVIFRRHDGAAVLVDFEESVATYASPAWDLGYFVQRFCLPDAPSAGTLRQRLDAVRSAYGNSFPALSSIMRQCACYAMAILVRQRLIGGITAPLEEYEKFVRLERQAADYAALLEAK